MTQDEAKHVYFRGRREIIREPQLIREAYEDSSFRENVIFDLSKSVAKEGNFSLVFWLDTLACALSNDQAVSLYKAIRDQSRMAEIVWRDEFAAAFPDTHGQLPDIPKAKIIEAISSKLKIAVEYGQFDNLRTCFCYMKQYSINCNELLCIDLSSINNEETGLRFASCNQDKSSTATLLKVAEILHSSKDYEVIHRMWNDWELQSG